MYGIVEMAEAHSYTFEILARQQVKRDGSSSIWQALSNSISENKLLEKMPLGKITTLREKKRRRKEGKRREGGWLEEG